MDQQEWVWPEGQRAAVSLTFDDARPSQLDVGLGVLNRHGVRGTFFVSFKNMDARVGEWRVVVGQGHEIGNHTVTHPCSGNYPFSCGNALETYTLDRMEKELTDANAHIQASLGVTPVSFAYPCYQTWVGTGSRHASYVPLVARHFSFARAIGEAANDPWRCDPVLLMSAVMDGMPANTAIDLIRRAADLGRWLILTGHNVGPSGSQCVPTDTLEAICAHGAERCNGVWMERLDRVGQYVADYRRRGDHGG